MGRPAKLLRPVRSIRARITAAATLFVAVILIVAAAIAVPVLGRTLTGSVAETVDGDLDSLESQLEASPSQTPRIIAAIDDDLLVRLATPGGQVVLNDDDADGLAESAAGEEDGSEITVDDGSWLAVTEDTDAGTLTVARPLEHVGDTVTATTVLLAAVVPLMVVLVALVVWVVTGRSLRPVERLRRQVDSIGASDLSRRVDGGDDELGALAATMNRMLGRLEKSRTVQRRFVSDASHELRSPLATIRQYAELAVAHPEAVATAELGQIVVGEGERMQDLVDGLLLLARLDESRRPPMTPVDLDDLVLRDADRLCRSGDRRGTVTVDTTGVGAGRVHGNDRLLARVVRNLVDNAARHAERKVELRLHGESTDRGERVLLTVADDGAGVPPGDRERIFDRFTRLDEGRTRDAGGSGLGLAIVREVVGVHGGTVSVGAGPRGGAVFTVDLPASPENG
ncbi:HAMP domain-containing sensor histidine kinase [uncultured Corynebacterium sp.]|uniref:sensor histidine kinase n=1 Tax=uncultured Corynebacterium sp. TaxID=159447 RepID=UPI0025EA8947|nr:HAMP domain-containing sensor histidine kinase [uncultured Corynebacterium sp.]